MIGAVEIARGLVTFKPAIPRRLGGLRQQFGDLRFIHGPKTARGLQGLLKDGQGIATGDDDAGGQIHGKVEALDGGKSIAAEEETCAHGLHAENTDFILHKNGKDFLTKAFVVSVHGV